MASANHINYWNYLETVTANRNKEALQGALNESTIDLNKTQEVVNAALTNKLGADTAQGYANAQSTLANIGFSARKTAVMERDLAFQIDKFAKQLQLDTQKAVWDKAFKVESIKFDYAKLAQDLGIHTDKMTQAQAELFQKYVAEANDLIQTIISTKQKAVAAEDSNETEKSKQASWSAGDISKLVSTIVGLLKFI